MLVHTDKCQNAGLGRFKICKSQVNDSHHCRSLPGLPWGPPPWSLRRGDPLLLQPRTLPSLKEKAKSVFCKLVISASYSIKQSGSSPVDSVNTLVWRDFESERGRCWLNDDRDKCALACYSPQIQIQIQTIVGKMRRRRRHVCAVFRARCVIFFANGHASAVFFCILLQEAEEAPCKPRGGQTCFFSMVFQAILRQILNYCFCAKSFCLCYFFTLF